MLVFVTGGTGLLGSYVIDQLINRGHTVRAIRRTAKLPFHIPTGIMERVEWFDGDVRDPVSLSEAMNGAEGIVHAAAVVSFHKEERKNMYAVNVEGTANVVNVALELGVRRIIHVSSVAAIGRSAKEETVSEERRWEDSSNNTHYAKSKHAAEMHVWRGFAEGLSGAIVNPSTLLGYGDWHQSSNAIFHSVYKGLKWYTDGKNGFTGVEDAARAVVELLESPVEHQRFIINAENWTFKRLLTTIAECFEKAPPSAKAGASLATFAMWMDNIRSTLSGSRPFLTSETVRVAQSKTSFAGEALLRALPHFNYTSLDEVIKKACENYKIALKQGVLRV